MTGKETDMNLVFIRESLNLAHRLSLTLVEGNYLNKGEAIGFVDGLVQQTDACLVYVRKLEGLVDNND